MLSNTVTHNASLLSGCNQFYGLKWLREGAKLSLRAVLHPVATRAWIGFLNSDALFADLVAVRPRLVGKIYRPYQTNTISCLQRVASLIGHYRFVQRLGWGPLTLRAAVMPVEVAAITGKTGAQYGIELCAVEPMDREGELVLRLSCGDVLVYSCAFTFIQTAQDMQLGIGCMQGPRGGDGLEVIRAATRDLHGLRPKNLMIKLLSVLGHEVGCKQMRLVSNRNRVVLSAQRQGKVHANYDEFWLSCGATPASDGNFLLPCGAIEEPDLSRTASSKRSMARKRHETVSRLAATLLTTLHKASTRSRYR